MSRPRRIALVCAASALVTCGSAMIATVAGHGGHVTALIRMSEKEALSPIAREHDPHFAFVPSTSHYDGAYFYAISLDPLARGKPSDAITNDLDRGAYRYGHPGYGWLAWLVSGGRAALAPIALVLLALVGVALGAAAASMLGTQLGMTPWVGLVVVFNPGVVLAATSLTSETVGVALLMLALLAWTRRRVGWASAASVGACFTKEVFLLIPAAFIAWEIASAIRRHERGWFGPGGPARNSLLLAVGPAFFAIWYTYLTLRFNVVPAGLARDLVGFPLVGWIDSIRLAIEFESSSFTAMELGYASVALIVSTGSALIAGLVFAVRLKTAISLVYIGLTLVALSLTWLGVLYPQDLIRDVSMSLALLPYVLGGGLAQMPVPDTT
jgi:hypothetical protein